jgi:hypothetical protein
MRFSTERNLQFLFYAGKILSQNVEAERFCDDGALFMAVVSNLFSAHRSSGSAHPDPQLIPRGP